MFASCVSYWKGKEVKQGEGRSGEWEGRKETLMKQCNRSEIRHLSRKLSRSVPRSQFPVLLFVGALLLRAVTQSCLPRDGALR